MTMTHEQPETPGHFTAEVLAAGGRAEEVCRRKLQVAVPRDFLTDVRTAIEELGYDYWLDGEYVDGEDTVYEFKSSTHPAIDVRVKGV